VLLDLGSLTIGFDQLGPDRAVEDDAPVGGDQPLQACVTALQRVTVSAGDTVDAVAAGRRLRRSQRLQLPLHENTKVRIDDDHRPLSQRRIAPIFRVGPIACQAGG
jgi:hypothetical protein